MMTEAERKQRTHTLIQLGGLVRLSGLADTPPALLLGVFLEVADRLPQLSNARRKTLEARGHTVLNHRQRASTPNGQKR